MKNRLPAAIVVILSLGLVPAGAQILLDRSLTGGTPAASEPVTVEARLALRSDSLSLKLTLTMGKNIHVYSAESLFFAVKVARHDGLGAPRIELPRPVLLRNVDGTAAEVYVGGQTIAAGFPVLSPRWTLEGSLRFQACDDTRCFLPATKRFFFSSDAVPDGPQALGGFTDDDAPADEKTGSGWKAIAGGFRVEGKTGGYMSGARFLSFLENPKASTAGSGFAGKNIWLVLVLVVLGGLALNLTPCVLPMIPITVAILGGGAQTDSRAKGFLLGSVYGLAMALTYGMLGIVVVLTGTQFGVINSSPLFNILIAVVFAVLALAMFDILHIDFTRLRSGLRQDGKKRGRYLTAFFAGIVAALLAGACVAPAVISTVLYAGTLYSGGTKAGVFLPLLLGIGMALPWPLAGAGLSFLPKPGRWMAVVRNSFGVLILAIAVYYGYGGVKMLFVPKTPQATAADSIKSGSLSWEHSLEQGLLLADAENRPVFIDFWATWCKNCLAMDASIFREAKVQEKLSEFVLVKYQAENPRDPAVKEVLDRFGVVGLPAYVVLRRK
ncbi:MAG: thioredoxin family protein [Chitinispirillaceae bacterium]|nr:thioredoxin family protein [Chitinispirillaceae bacterium]